MRIFPTVILVSAILFHPVSQAEEDNCRVADVGPNVSRNHPECLFYTGTEHFRNERMADAVSSWSELIAVPNIPPDVEVLQVNALNNLGFMYFFAYGISVDKAKAVGYWKSAVALGHSESEYHLCHAYADADQPTYNVQRARRHCDKAEAIYKAIENPDEDTKTILEQIREYRKSAMADNAQQGVAADS